VFYGLLLYVCRVLKWFYVDFIVNLWFWNLKFDAELFFGGLSGVGQGY
jgi:hypothetical protein